MIIAPKYLIDSNIFIDGHNRFYHPNFCEIFWDWMNEGHKHGVLFSLDKVKEEITRPDPSKNELSKLIRDQRVPKSFFLPSFSNVNLINSYNEVIKWSANHSFYSIDAKEEFAQSYNADAFLISVAKVSNFIIVTEENSQPDDKKRIRIPDAAKNFNIKTLRLDKLLKLHAENNFQFKF